MHGGIQPISGATIQLFAVGTGGNGSPATSLLTRPVTTDSQSNFSITGDYSCASANEQVYLVARGGNPGFAGNVNNNSITMLSALGSCGALSASTFIEMNEVSTAAAVYALAPFMTSYDHIGSSATNSLGIANAFLNAHLLADTATGRSAAPSGQRSLEVNKLYALADAIVPCVNSAGGAACAPLFAAATPPGGAVPADVLGALLSIAKHPANNVATIYNLIGPVPPYPTALTSAPNDWTMSLTVAGGSIAAPTALGIDRFGNVWSANNGDGAIPSGVVALDPQGTALPGSPFGVGLQTEAYGLVVDKNSDVWVTSDENVSHGSTTGSVAKFHGAASSSVGSLAGQFSDVSLNYPRSIAADPAPPAGYPGTDGTILIGNYLGGTATIYDLNGNYVNSIGAGYAVFPLGISSDNAHGAWLADNGDKNIVHVNADGRVQVIACCNSAQVAKLDRHGNVWVTNYGRVNGNYAITEISPAGSILLNGQAIPGLAVPGSGTVDAGGQFWAANFYDGTFVGIAGNDSALPAGTALFPKALGKDANLREAYDIAADASGNLWISDAAGDKIVMFFGMATPTATPAGPLPAAP